MPTLDDTPVDLVYLTAATACVSLRRGFPADPFGVYSREIRVTLQDGIQRVFDGEIPFDMGQAGTGGLRQPLAEAVSTRYNLFLVPHSTNPNTHLDVIGDVTAPHVGPIGYQTNFMYVGSVYNDAASNLIPWLQAGEWFEHWQPIEVENVAAIDIAAVQVDLTTNGGMPSWASAANLALTMTKDAAAGVIAATFWQDNGAGAPRAVPEFRFTLDFEATAQTREHEFRASLSGGDGMIWRQRVTGAGSTCSVWSLGVRSYRDPYIR